MLKKLFPYLPHHLIAWYYGFLSRIEIPAIKNHFIRKFIRVFNVDMSESLIESPEEFKNFRDFFIRHLKPEARTWSLNPQHLLSPVDGAVSQWGAILNNTLLQAKGRTYALSALLGDGAHRTSFSPLFQDGRFMTLYLAPKDYHRIHMPVNGALTHTRYIPGRLFPVNPWSVDNVANVFARNERLVMLFETEFGPMALIMVGAFIVGNIVTHFDNQVVPFHRLCIVEKNYEKNPLTFTQSEEIAHFTLGSTVILLLPKACEFLPTHSVGKPVRLAEMLAGMSRD